jgi:hypothetical protein
VCVSRFIIVIPSAVMLNVTMPNFLFHKTYYDGGPYPFRDKHVLGIFVKTTADNPHLLISMVWAVKQLRHMTYDY